MTRGSNGRYSKEFRIEAVKMVVEGGVAVYEASRQLSLPKSTLENWVRAFKAGKLSNIGGKGQQRPLTEVELELDRVKRELAQVKQERDILKKAAAYFAKESLPGTR
ncbi:transposase [Desulfuromonas soudanensis]|jgi:transposase|uniref:Transposase n=1 Tax=Desulfuromonas soudanensis TaxID=1603606 RepID=A0A0M4D5M6_9BACT|nr:transposase [Desulfuromonas soudanensis]ALC17036.1 transposase [Desulfuromonas soudanensis]ALC17504.1 transposase [Desulfuromonas soudanensis]ALC18061.1 transposase [Desulfuromonas soudanensis]ALC18197.1 transposase [Desulfuromonas soudanensis]